MKYGAKMIAESTLEAVDNDNPDRNYEIDFPTALLEYKYGSYNFRFGLQQIAWGQAIFFRVLDSVDGLDLRRHSVLDYAQEEYSDKRVPAPAVRVLRSAHASPWPPSTVMTWPVM